LYEIVREQAANSTNLRFKVRQIFVAGFAVGQRNLIARQDGLASVDAYHLLSTSSVRDHQEVCCLVGERANRGKSLPLSPQLRTCRAGACEEYLNLAMWDMV